MTKNPPNSFGLKTHQIVLVLKLKTEEITFGRLFTILSIRLKQFPTKFLAQLFADRT